MTPLEMAKAAAESMAAPGASGPEMRGVVLTIPKGQTPKGFPRGELLCETELDGEVIRTSYFNAAKVLAWLIRNDLVVMEQVGSRTLSFRATGGAP